MDEIIIDNGVVRMVCRCEMDGWHIRMPPSEGEHVAGPYIAAMLARIKQLESELATAQAAAKPKRSDRMKVPQQVGGECVFADIRAAYVAADGSIERTVNGSIMPPGTDLYVLGDVIE